MPKIPAASSCSPGWTSSMIKWQKLKEFGSGVSPGPAGHPGCG